VGNFYTNITLKAEREGQIVAFLRSKSRAAFVSKPTDGFVVVYDAESESQDDEVLRRLARELSESFDCPALAVLNHDDDILCYYLFQSGEELDCYNSNPNYFSGQPVPPAGGDALKLIEALRARCDSGQLEKILQSSPNLSADSAQDVEEQVANYFAKIKERILNNPSVLQNLNDPAALANIESLAKKFQEDASERDAAQVSAPGGYIFAVERHSDLVKTLELPDLAVGVGYNYLRRGEFPPPFGARDFQHT